MVPRLVVTHQEEALSLHTLINVRVLCIYFDIFPFKNLYLFFIYLLQVTTTNTICRDLGSRYIFLYRMLLRLGGFLG